MSEELILAMSQSADFYPGLRDDEECADYDGTHIEWTFSLPRSASVRPGIFKIEFIRSLAEEEALGNPVLGDGPRRKASGQ